MELRKSANPYLDHVRQQEAKRKEDEAATAQVYADFVSSFDAAEQKPLSQQQRRGSASVTPSPSSFVRGGVFDPSGGSKQRDDGNKRETYVLGRQKRTEAQEEEEAAAEPHREVKPLGFFRGIRDDPEESPARSQQHQTTRNKRRTINELREEMERRSEGRHSRQQQPHKQQQQQRQSPKSSCIEVRGIPSAANDETLVTEFGRFGPIAMVGIDGDPTQLQTRVGFVAFMSSQASESALAFSTRSPIFLFGCRVSLHGRDAIADLPPYPLTVMDGRIHTVCGWPFTRELATAALSDISMTANAGEHVVAEVKVVLPSDIRRRALIDRVANAVASHGSSVEDALVDRTRGNGDTDFNFIVNDGSAEGTYYRWKVFSILQGDTSNTAWRTSPFQMFVGCQWWQPPLVPQYASSLSGERLSTASSSHHREERHHRGRSRSRSRSRSHGHGHGHHHGQKRHRSPQRKENQMLTRKELEVFRAMLTGLTISNSKICEAMGFALDHADAADEVAAVTTEHLTDKRATAKSLVPGLFLVSDILHNSSSAVHNAFAYRSRFEERLPAIFRSIASVHRSVEGRLTAFHLREQVTRVLRVWEKWSIFSQQFISGLESTLANHASVDDVDGVPLPDPTEPIPKRKS